jgi:BirA family biotin operon repressor/biotin-[acetyl-CoA-carboxylase] ligase
MIVGRKVLLKEEVASTNDVAKALALEGEEEGTVVVAKTQLAGRGRMGRSWSSPLGGLYLSVVLRPDVSVGDMLLLTVLSSVPVAQAIEELTGLEAKLKWPNDIEVDGRKVAGILVESASKSGNVGFLVLGIGINLNTDPLELDGRNPGSLSSMTKRTYDPDASMHRALYHLDAFYERYRQGDRDTAEYVRRSSTLGRHITASVGDQRVSGQAIYIDLQGALVIKGDDGLTYRLDSVYTLHYE